MATVYLRSTDGSDGDNGSTWALADATGVASLVAAGAGGVSYASQAHAETQASAMTLTSPGTAASPTKIVCANDGAEPPTAVATTGTISTTGNNAISFAGFAYCYGIGFTAGNASGAVSINWTSSSAWGWIHDTCSFALGSNNAAGRYNIGTGSGSTLNAGLELRNCTLAFTHVSQAIAAGCAVKMLGGSIAATGSVPTTLFAVNSGYEAADVTLRGVDLSAFGSGKTLVNATGTLADVYRFIDCKLAASVTISSGGINGPNGTRIWLVNCDSADTNYRFYYQDYFGTITHETTIKRTGGASDGTTGFSRKFVSTAATSFSRPLYGPWFKFWNSTIGSVTVPIEVVTDNVTLTDAEAYVEVLYPGTSGYPLGVFANDRAADILASAANQTTSSETWTTTGLTTPVKQVLSKAVTPTGVGWIYARVVLAKASTTLYACPKILAGSTQYMEEDGSIVNVAASGSSVLNSGIRTGGKL